MNSSQSARQIHAFSGHLHGDEQVKDGREISHFSSVPQEDYNSMNNSKNSARRIHAFSSLSNHLHGDHHQVKDGRERLKRHREEVAGSVSIPDKWGQEELLKDWIDCSAFEALSVPHKIASARKALAADHGSRARTTSSHHHHQQQPQQIRIVIK
ncbi:Protein BIC1 [Melia azedarach]|uniref:Protein BIC1 n=1 Tax=Melia azedarach TaxID=155640 RepID=A0ACC1YMQ6_MELAZ|nr:Protein BIC1 [Melia azedarach]